MDEKQMNEAVSKLEADLTAANAKFAELEKASARQDKVLKLSADDRGVFDQIEGVEKQDAFLAADESGRKAIAKQFEEPEVTVDPEVTKRFEAIEKAHKDELAAIAKRLETAEGAVRDHKSRADAIMFAKKAETDYPNLPGTPEEKGASLQALSKLDEKEREGVSKLLGAGDAAIAQLGKGQGKTTTSVSKGNGALAKLEAKAEEIRKSDSKLSKEQAYDRALSENPDLYQQYMDEGAPTA